MDSKETQQQQQPQENAITPDSLPMLHLHLPQQPLMLEGSSSHYPVTIQEQPLMLEGSSWHYPVATQEQPSMQRGVIDGGAANVMLPRGSVNKQRRNALGEEGGRSITQFTPHVIHVNAGEDIATELVAFLNQEPHDVCILSATGAVSSAWLQSNSPLEIVKYEGLHDIVRLSGTFSSTECHDGTVTITGNLIVSLAGPDNKLLGGRVGGRLVAGSPVQVTVGSFVPERVELSAASAPDNVLSLSGGGPGLPQYQGPQFSSEPSEEDGSESPLHQVGTST